METIKIQITPDMGSVENMDDLIELMLDVVDSIEGNLDLALEKVA